MTTTTTEAPTVDPPAPARTDQLEIVVSLEDIRDGVQGDSRECAVALALRRAGHQLIEVTILCGVHADRKEYFVTPELKAWLVEFDHNRRGVQPERFRLNPMQP